MNKNLVVFSSLFMVLSLAAFLFFKKYLSLGIYHSIYYCQTLFGGTMRQIPRELNILIIGSALALVGLVSLRLLLLFSKLKSFQKSVRSTNVLPNSLQGLISELGLNGKVHLVSANKPFAFCWGIRNPRICLSTKVIKLMSREETRAILLHEKYHLDHHDGLTLLIGRITENLFPLFPVISDLVSNFRVKREISADYFAIKHMGKQVPIKNALRKLLFFENRAVAVFPAFTDSDTLEGRILALTGKKSPPRLNLINVFLSVSVFLIILGVVATPISAYEIHHDQTDAVVVCLNSNVRNFSVPASQTPY